MGASGRAMTVIGLMFLVIGPLLVTWGFFMFGGLARMREDAQRLDQYEGLAGAEPLASNVEELIMQTTVVGSVFVAAGAVLLAVGVILLITLGRLTR